MRGTFNSGLTQWNLMSFFTKDACFNVTTTSSQLFHPSPANPLPPIFEHGLRTQQLSSYLSHENQ